MALTEREKFIFIMSDRRSEEAAERERESGVRFLPPPSGLFFYRRAFPQMVLSLNFRSAKESFILFLHI